MTDTNKNIKGIIQKEKNGNFHCGGEQCDYKKCCKKYKKAGKTHCKKCPKL
tara:strand:- start:236 stop:388 length:153 start_codon:yes stop_codon:yes gene_type:complete